MTRILGVERRRRQSILSDCDRMKRGVMLGRPTVQCLEQRCQENAMYEIKVNSDISLQRPLWSRSSSDECFPEVYKPMRTY
jgi:hypothetical protein